MLSKKENLFPVYERKSYLHYTRVKDDKAVYNVIQQRRTQPRDHKLYKCSSFNY